MDDHEAPIYRVRDYQQDDTSKRDNQRPSRSKARKRRTKRKLSQSDYSVSDVLWVIVAAVLFTVILIVSGVVVVAQFIG